MANYLMLAPGNMRQGTSTLPDGVVVPVAAGRANIPQAWVTWAVGFGWAFS